MLSITLRLAKGSELTHAETDGNFLAVASALGEWRSDVTYSQGRFTVYSGKIYASSTNSNINKQPDLNPSDWFVYVPVHSHVFADIAGIVKDETNMVSNSTTHVPTQRSVKAYVDALAAAIDYTDQDARDAISVAVQDSPTIEWSTDSPPITQITATVVAGSLTPSHLDSANSPITGDTLTFDGTKFLWGVGANPFRFIREGSFLAGDDIPVAGARGSVAIGADSTIDASSSFSMVFGTECSIADGAGSSEYSGVFGGFQNSVVNSDWSGVYAGKSNIIGQSAESSAIVAGDSNTNTGTNSVVIGGNNNDVTADNCSVLSGQDSVANVDFSTTIGPNAATYLPGEIAVASGPLDATIDGVAQARILPGVRGESVDGTTQTLLLGLAMSTQLGLETQETWSFRAQVVARQVGGSSGTVGDSAAFNIEGCVKTIAGTASLVGTAVTTNYADAAASAWTAVLTVSSNELRIRVTGETDKTIHWNASVYVTSVT